MKKGRTKLRKLIGLVLSAVILGFIFSVYMGISIYSFGWRATPEKSDCIIVLGCQVKGREPSPFLKARLDEGQRLYEEGYGDYIILSGGKGTGEEITEAEAMKNYLLRKGIPEESILMEEQSKSTMENLRNSKAVMDEKGFKNAVIISNKYHLKRASLMAKRVGIDASYSGVFVDSYKSYEISGFIREILAFIKYFIIGWK